MNKTFKQIGIMAKTTVPNIADTIRTLTDFLDIQAVSYLIDEDVVKPLDLTGMKTVGRDDIGKQCDLLIVVGGDGSLLNAARRVVLDGIPVLGINRGRLGFLTDICPSEITQRLGDILAGHYKEEHRSMLQLRVKRQGESLQSAIALNDVVLYSGAMARMIEYEIWVDGQFVCSQRSDGLIISTPTGSTAYALSGGGPILHPALNAIVLVPMHPHTLTSRPLVLDGNAQVELRVSSETDHLPLISCDGHIHIKAAEINDRIVIDKLPTPFRLIHPLDHDYYAVLRNKLSWSSKST